MRLLQGFDTDRGLLTPTPNVVGPVHATVPQPAWIPAKHADVGPLLASAGDVDMS